MTLDFTILRELSEIEAIASEWDALVAETGADIYFHRTWIETWWEVFGAGRRPLIACIRLPPSEGGRLVGLLVFVTEEFRLAGARLRVARLAGANPNYALLRLPLIADRAAAALAGTLQTLIRQESHDAVSLSPLSDGSADLRSLQEALAAEPGLSLVPDPEPRQHMQIPLPESFDAYMASLSSNRRSKYRRSKRMIEEEQGLVTEVLTGQDAAGFFDRFVALHNAQFQSRGKLGHFDDWPGSREFYARLCWAMAGTGRVRFYVQKDAAGQVYSALFCFVAGSTCHAHLTAREESEALASANLGLHAQFERIERLIDENVTTVESGAGEYSYKRSLNGDTLPMRRILVGGSTRRARARLKILVRWADILNLVYYRIWFNRLAPRLRHHGLARGPLWAPWRRTRL